VLTAARPGLVADEVERRGLVATDLLVRIGVRVDPGALERAGVVLADGWLMSRTRAQGAARQLTALVAEHERSSPLSAGPALPVLAERLGLPSIELVRAVVAPPLRVEAGRVTARTEAALPETLRRTVEVVLADLAEAPFAAPTAGRLAEVGLDNKGAAAAAKAGLLLRPAPGIVLPPDADRLAAERLAELPQPFTTSEARAHLGTSRRVALPLLDHLDRRGLTRRHTDDRREVTGR
jgi:selenocysteine-specific elongation factor